MDPRPFLQGDIFDSVMHYQWYKPARRLFAHAEGGMSTDFIAEMNRVYAGYSPAQTQNMMNLVASHDSPRFGTSFQNKHKYKYRMGARGNKELKLGPPGADVVREMRMMLLHQFTLPVRHTSGAGNNRRCGAQTTPTAASRCFGTTWSTVTGLHAGRPAPRADPGEAGRGDV